MGPGYQLPPDSTDPYQTVAATGNSTPHKRISGYRAPLPPHLVRPGRRPGRVRSHLARPGSSPSGGERGIRTLETAFGSLHDFQSCSFGQLGHLSIGEASPREKPVDSQESRVESFCQPLLTLDSQLSTFFLWRRGWDSNPRGGFWPPNRFRGGPVMTTSVPLLNHSRVGCVSASVTHQKMPGL